MNTKKTEEQEQQRIQDLREIAIVIDTWDDIFSDFDPRPLNERIVSEDFLFEIKRRYLETRAGDFRVVIFAPLSLKDDVSEEMVIGRLKRHFLHRYLQRQKQIIRLRMRGAIFVLCGILFLTILTLAAYFQWYTELVIEVLGIVAMPLGWFGIWEGFSKLVDTSPKYIQEELLFNKLAKVQYKFKYIGEDNK